MDNQFEPQNNQPTPEPMEPTELTESLSPVETAAPEAQPVIEQTETVVTETSTETSMAGTAPAAEAAPITANPAPTAPIETTDSLTPKPKKKNKGVLIGIIIAALLALGGGGTFAALAIIKSQPENQLASALSNLAGADQLSVEGSLTYKIDSSLSSSMSSLPAPFDNMTSVTLNLGNRMSGKNQTSSLASTLNFSDGTTLDLFSVEDAFMKDGTIYVRIAGIKSLYDGTVKPILDTASSLMTSSNIESANVNSNTFPTDCATYETDCISSYYSPSYTSSLSSLSTILPTVEEIIGVVDGKWIKISVDDIMDSELLSSLTDSSTKEQVKKAYHCAVDTLLNDKTSNELVDIYNENSFVTMDKADDFYRLSFEANKAANFVNAIPKAKFVDEIASCAGGSFDKSSLPTVSGSDISSTFGSMPNIYAKFDGFMDYKLTELKIEQASDYATLSGNLKFTYPTNLNVVAPSSATPVLDIVETIINKLGGNFGYLLPDAGDNNGNNSNNGNNDNNGNNNSSSYDDITLDFDSTTSGDSSDGFTFEYEGSLFNEGDEVTFTLPDGTTYTETIGE